MRLAGRFEEGRQRARSVLERDPRSVRAQLMVAIPSGSLGDLDGAVTDVRKAIEMDPKRAEAYIWDLRQPRNGAGKAAER